MGGDAHRGGREHARGPRDPGDADELLRHEPLEHGGGRVEVRADVAEAVEAANLLPFEHPAGVLQYIQGAGVVGRLEEELEVLDALGDGLDAEEEVREGEEVLAADVEGGDADGGGHEALVEGADEVAEGLHLVARLGNAGAQLLAGLRGVGRGRRQDQRGSVREACRRLLRKGMEKAARRRAWRTPIVSKKESLRAEISCESDQQQQPPV